MRRGPARHAAARAAGSARSALLSRVGRVTTAVLLAGGVVAAGTGAVTASSPATTAEGSSTPLLAPASADAALDLPDDGPGELRAERAEASEHRAQVRAAQEAEAARRAAEEAAAREAAEREAAERAAAEEAQRRADEEAAARAAEEARAEREAEAAAASRSAQRDPRGVAASMVADRGWSSDQMSCLDQLWTKESGWQFDADNPTSSAYGIPQALPGSKMASAGADWETNPVTQITWGLQYIADVYGTPCSAWSHSQATNWY
ncbi:hypothetical protein [uncultured Pseudokineococcus sp.]|uniref:aggregation-promoting factor C-terminal-like domain-containing protein n=1 Tax=uncultured Pseudokineococcus sp. TaxID=1642928 RepID=UPI00260F8B41|nr:hypothetical protein [uncultured Pseudokineococcus sp.]